VLEDLLQDFGLWSIIYVIWQVVLQKIVVNNKEKGPFLGSGVLNWSELSIVD